VLPSTCWGQVRVGIEKPEYKIFSELGRASERKGGRRRSEPCEKDFSAENTFAENFLRLCSTLFPYEQSELGIQEVALCYRPDFCDDKNLSRGLILPAGSIKDGVRRYESGSQNFSAEKYL
jgi:hypothetical protein